MPGNSSATNTTYTNSSVSNFIEAYGSTFESPYIQMVVDKPANGISPQLYFSYIKSKFRMLERMKMESQKKRMEKAFEKAMTNGQELLGSKIMNEVVRIGREAVLFAKGIKFFIEEADLRKFKNKIRGGHISDTQLADYTRLIPENVLKRLGEVKDLFDGFVIYHYWNPAAPDVKKMDPEEKARMKDPVLFGYFKNLRENQSVTDIRRLYFIADWEDEFCDLTFSELVDAIGKDEDEHKLDGKPVFNTN